MDMWHTMAYGVAKELSMRPLDVLTQWSCEELLVAFGFYANQSSSTNYEMLSQKERAKRGMTSIDRWAMPFVTDEQLANMGKEVKRNNDELEEYSKLAEVMFG